jgi:hypothetical protein
VSAATIDAHHANAHRAALRIIQDQPNIICSGWQYHCICPRHQNVTDGLVDRYRKAIAADDQHTAQLLADEIQHQQQTLGLQR